MCVSTRSALTAQGMGGAGADFSNDVWAADWQMNLWYLLCQVLHQSNILSQFKIFAQTTRHYKVLGKSSYSCGKGTLYERDLLAWVCRGGDWIAILLVLITSLSIEGHAQSTESKQRKHKISNMIVNPTGPARHIKQERGRGIQNKQTLNTSWMRFTWDYLPFLRGKLKER